MRRHLFLSIIIFYIGIHLYANGAGDNVSEGKESPLNPTEIQNEVEETFTPKSEDQILTNKRLEILNHSPDFDLLMKDGEYDIGWDTHVSNGKLDFQIDETIIEVAGHSNPGQSLQAVLQPVFGTMPFEFVNRFILLADIKFIDNSSGEWGFAFGIGNDKCEPVFVSGNNEGFFRIAQFSGVLAEGNAASFIPGEQNHIEIYVSPESIIFSVNEEEVFNTPFDSSELYGNFYWVVNSLQDQPYHLAIEDFRLWNIRLEKVSELAPEEREFFEYNDKSGLLSIQMVSVPGGSFLMGHPDITRQQQKVILDSYKISQYPITYGEWNEIKSWAINQGYSFKGNAFTGKNEYTTELQALKTPASKISWYDCLVWCNALSEYENRKPMYYIDQNYQTVYRDSNQIVDPIFCLWNGNGYQLPTEAEWEYAARSAGRTEGNLYSGSEDPKQTVNYSGNPQPYGEVDRMNPNQLGIYDMSGNIYEWCWDWLSGKIPEGMNPTGPFDGVEKITRGSSVYSDARPDSYRGRGSEPWKEEYNCLRVIRH